MSGALPVCSGAKAVGAFIRAGWQERAGKRKQRGSHKTLIKPGSAVVLTVPQHHELDRGLLRDLIRNAGLTVDDSSNCYNRQGFPSTKTVTPLVLQVACS